MRRMENHDIHAVNLELLRHIDAFCRGRNITYFLDSGTLLGAARDGAFIPWDDDADIVMPRPDYERFVKEYIDSENYRLFAPSRGNCFLPYARLCEMKRTYFKQVSIWTKEDPGVGVDVFPLDGAPDSAEDFDKLATKIVKARDRIWRYRAAMSHRVQAGFRKDIKGFLKGCIHYIARKIRGVAPEFFIARNIEKIRRLRMQYPLATSRNCFYIVVNSSRGKFWRKEWFADKAYIALSGSKFPAPVGYDERLKAEYGDWRTPPPASERTGHVANQTMFWRDK